MIIFLYGSDTFRSREQMRRMVSKFKSDRDPEGLNVIHLDSEKNDSGIVMGQLLSVPFLAERRMIVLENLLISKQKDLRSSILKRIEENNFPETNIIIFWEGVDKFKTKDAKEFFLRLQKEKYVQNFEELRGVKLGGWIGAEVKERVGKISGAAVQYLVQHVGGDMWRLDSILDQLVAYCGKREIEIKDIQLFLDEKIDDNIFNLVDAAVGRQSKQVYSMIQEQYRQGQDPQYIFAMMLRQFRILLELSDVFEREGALQSNILATRLGLHPFVVKKSLPLIERYSLEELKKIHQDLLDFDVGMKTGAGGASMLLDVFVGRVCSRV